MRQYPIWNQINSCIYKSPNKSYGVKNHSEITTFIGSSSTHSYKFCNTKFTRRELHNGLILFRVYVDDIIIKEAIFCDKSKQLLENNLNIKSIKTLETI